MTNAEKYKKEIRKVTEELHENGLALNPLDITFSVYKDAKGVEQVGECVTIHDCVKCIFEKDEIHCRIQQMHWLMSECEEPVLTKREKEVCRIFYDGFRCLAFIIGGVANADGMCIIKEDEDKIYFTNESGEKIYITEEILKRCMPLKFNGLEKGKSYYLCDLVKE